MTKTKQWRSHNPLSMVQIQGAKEKNRRAFIVIQMVQKTLRN